MSTTVRELINKLQAMPQEAVVLVDGYEGGLSDIGAIKTTLVDLNVNKEDYYGPHEESSSGSTNAVLLRRAPNPNS